MPKRYGAETCINCQNAVAVVTSRKESCPSECTADYLALNLLGCEYSYSIIFIIIVFPYTGSVTGTELGDEFYRLPLEINILIVFTSNSGVNSFYPGNRRTTGVATLVTSL